MKQLNLTDEEAEVLSAELSDLEECLKDSCECEPNAPICLSCQELPLLHSIRNKLREL